LNPIFFTRHQSRPPPSPLKCEPSKKFVSFSPNFLPLAFVSGVSAQ
jgi:hypothetical protein